MSNGRYIKPSNEKEYVWIVWVMENLEVEGRRKIHSVHKTKKSAFKAEGLLPRNEFQYYSIETKELTDE
jgi:hypothetical protein